MTLKYSFLNARKDSHEGPEWGPFPLILNFRNNDLNFEYSFIHLKHLFFPERKEEFHHLDGSHLVMRKTRYHTRIGGNDF